MERARAADGYPRTVALLLGLLALVWVNELRTFDLRHGVHFVLGMPLPGLLGFVALGAELAVLLYGVLGCLRRRRAMVRLIIGVAVYLIADLWLVLLAQGAVLYGSLGTPLLVNALATSALLAFCRLHWSRRDTFAG